MAGTLPRPAVRASRARVHLAADDVRRGRRRRAGRAGDPLLRGDPLPGGPRRRIRCARPAAAGTRATPRRPRRDRRPERAGHRPRNARGLEGRVHRCTDQPDLPAHRISQGARRFHAACAPAARRGARGGRRRGRGDPVGRAGRHLLPARLRRERGPAAGVRRAARPARGNGRPARGHRQRVARGGPPRSRPRRRGRARPDRRDDRPAEGRHADAPQPGVQCPGISRLDGPAARRADPVHVPDLPRHRPRRLRAARVLGAIAGHPDPPVRRRSRPRRRPHLASGILGGGHHRIHRARRPPRRDTGGARVVASAVLRRRTGAPGCRRPVGGAARRHDPQRLRTDRVLLAHPHGASRRPGPGRSRDRRPVGGPARLRHHGRGRGRIRKPGSPGGFSERSSPAVRRSPPGTGAGRTIPTRRCATAGCAPATSGSWTPTAGST